MTTGVLATPDDLLDSRYELLDVLGRGGMADVHAAHDRLLDRTVAVKVLRNPADPTQRSRFLAEAKVLATLSHHNIVALLDAGQTAETPYLVMELAPGRTLSQRVADGPLAPGLVARIGAQVADALCHAHACGIVHRDVKPSNILVAEDGSARLADFGIARLVGECDRHTRTDETVGSPAYLAPEQVTGADITPAIDIYSLGLVLLEALTGRRAYAGTPVEAAIARLRTAPLIPTSLGPVWVNLLEQMTRLEPRERPDAARVAATLAALAGERVEPVVLADAEATGAFVLLEAAERTSVIPAWSPGRRRVLALGIAAAITSLMVVAGVAQFSPGPADAAPVVTGTPVPDWDTRFLGLFVTPRPEATASVRDTAPAPAKAKPVSKKNVVPGQAKKGPQKHHGKGKPGKAGRG